MQLVTILKNYFFQTTLLHQKTSKELLTVAKHWHWRHLQNMLSCDTEKCLSLTIFTHYNRDSGLGLLFLNLHIKWATRWFVFQHPQQGEHPFDSLLRHFFSDIKWWLKYRTINTKSRTKEQINNMSFLNVDIVERKSWMSKVWGGTIDSVAFSQQWSDPELRLLSVCTVVRMCAWCHLIYCTVMPPHYICYWR